MEQHEKVRAAVKSFDYFHFIQFKDMCRASDKVSDVV